MILFLYLTAKKNQLTDSYALINSDKDIVRKKEESFRSDFMQVAAVELAVSMIDGIPNINS
jgi:hypothetical protein